MKNQPPFFSVVIPTLNEEKFLPRLLADLVVQKERDFEVLVVDGSSNDKTASEAKKFEHKLPLTVMVVNRSNVSVQRNFGAERAKGKYLVFFDADVQIPSRFLSQLHEYLLKHPVPFLTTYMRGDSRNMYDLAILRLFNLISDAAKLLDRPIVGGYNLIVLRGVFQTVGGFRQEVIYAEDQDLADRLTKNGYELTILRSPRLTFSLRRFRHEGRLTSMRRFAKASLHILTKGPITQEIFSYPMGGGHYKFKQKEQIKPQTLLEMERYVKKFVKLFIGN